MEVKKGLNRFMTFLIKEYPRSIQTTGATTTFENVFEYWFTFIEILLAFWRKGGVLRMRLFMPLTESTKTRKIMTPRNMAGMIRNIVDICDHRAETWTSFAVPIIRNTTSTTTNVRTTINGNHMVQKGLTGCLFLICSFMSPILTFNERHFLKLQDSYICYTNGVNNHFKVRIGEVIIHGKAQQLVTDPLGHRALTGIPSECLSH